MNQTSFKLISEHLNRHLLRIGFRNSPDIAGFPQTAKMRLGSTRPISPLETAVMLSKFKDKRSTLNVSLAPLYIFAAESHVAFRIHRDLTVGWQEAYYNIIPVLKTVQHLLCLNGNLHYLVNF